MTDKMTDKEKLQTLCDYLLNMSKNTDKTAADLWQKYISHCMNEAEGDTGSDSVKKTCCKLWKHYAARAEVLHEILQSIVDMDIL